MNIAEHPIVYLRSRLLNKTTRCTLEFSKYVYRERGKTFSRDIFEVESEDLSIQWLTDQLASLKEGQELALHSKIKYESRIVHLPMIDFINVSSTEKVRPEIEHIGARLRTDVWFYNSGTSLHGYYFILIETQKWYEYLGSLLLCNYTKGRDNEIIDSRWVGHSLEHGYSALRWSNNTDNYKSLPAISLTRE